MKNIKIKQVYIEGYRTIVKPLTFDMDRPGLNLLKGDIGTGKTSIIESIVWCLYRANLKNEVDDSVVTWDEYRTAAFRGTKVGVIMDVGEDEYEIYRHKDYKGETYGLKGGDKLMIFINGEMHGKDLQKKDQQEFIDGVLGINARVFTNSILFGQRMSKLIESDSDDIRKLLEKLFDLYWVEELKEKARKDREKLVENLNQFEKDRGILNARKADIQDTISEVYVKLDEYSEEIKEANQKVKNLEHSLTTLEYDEKRHSDKEKELEDLTKKVHEASVKDTKLKTELDSAENSYNIIVNKEKEALKKCEELEQELKEHYQSVEKDLVEVNKSIKDFEESIEALEFEEVEGVDEDLASLKAELTSVIKDKNTIENKLHNAETSKNSLERELENIPERCKECNHIIDAEAEEFMMGSKKQDIENLKKDLKRYKNLLSELDKDQLSIEDDIDVLETYKENEAAIKDYKYQIRILTKEKESIESRDEVLKECISNADKEYEKLKKDVKEAEETLYEKQDAYEGIHGTLSRLRQQELKLSLFVEDMNKLQNEVEKTSTNIWETKLHIKHLESNIDDSNNQVTLNKAKLKKIDTELDQLEVSVKETSEQLEIVNWWIDKAFSSSGLKAFVFAAMLTELNKKIIKYSSRLGVSVKFTVDLTKPSRPFSAICSVDGIENKPYKSFSGGQKAKVDISLMFGMHDLISMGTDINILLLDEVFEGLDEGAEASVFDLIRMKAKNKSVYVITHSAALDSLYSNVIEFSRNSKMQTEIKA